MCRICKTKIDQRGTLCLDCNNKQRVYESGLQTVAELKAKRGLRWRDIIRQHAARVISTDGAACAWCGYDKHVQRAHIKDVVDFPETTPIGVINDPANVILLCPNCHWEFDNG